MDGGDFLRYLVGGEDAELDGLEYTTFNRPYFSVTNGQKAVAAVRASPRYKQLIKDLRLDQYWRERGWPSFCRPLSEKAGRPDDFECFAEPLAK